MSVQISIETFLDDALARAQKREWDIELERTNEAIGETNEAIGETNEAIGETNEAIGETSKRAKEAFNEAMAAMRASYMMVSGIAQVMGTSMGAMFSSLYGTAVAAIGTYKAIAVAMAATGPAGWVQAGIMFTSLIAAGVSVVEIMSGQTELSRRISGINMALHGISSMIGSINF